MHCKPGGGSRSGMHMRDGETGIITTHFKTHLYFHIELFSLKHSAKSFNQKSDGTSIQKYLNNKQVLKPIT